MRGQTVYLYKLQHNRATIFLNALEDLGKQLQKRGASTTDRIALGQAKWLKRNPTPFLFLS